MVARTRPNVTLYCIACPVKFTKLTDGQLVQHLHDLPSCRYITSQRFGGTCPHLLQSRYSHVVTFYGTMRAAPYSDRFVATVVGSIVLAPVLLRLVRPVEAGLQTAVSRDFIPFLLICLQVFRCYHYIRNQQDATLALSFISHCKITLHVSEAFCIHHQEY